jgi:hypothetical protein
MVGMKASAGRPLVAATACVKHIAPHAYHVAGDKYVAAVSGGACRARAAARSAGRGRVA